MVDRRDVSPASSGSLIRAVVMRTSTMRRLDGTLGRAACRLLTLARRLAGPDRCPDGPPERILLIKFAEQGATVVAHPAIVRAAQLVGPQDLHMVVFAENRFIVDELGVIPQQNVLTVRSTNLAAMALDLVRVLVAMRRRHIDTTVDLESFSRLSAIVAYLSGARRRVGLHSFRGEGPDRGDLLTHRIAANARLHASDAFLVLVEASTLGPDRLPTLDLPSVADLASGQPAPPRIHPTPDEVARVRAMVSARLAVPDIPRLVLLNPSAGDLEPLRRWPARRYVQLAQVLLQRVPDISILLTGSTSEAPEVEEVQWAIGSARCASVAGATTLRELLVLYTLSEVLVTNDSGPAHYAALTPVEVVTLFGPETPSVFGSRSPRNRHLSADVPCSPCLNVFNGRRSDCTDNICMQRITLDSVAEVVLDLLGSEQRAFRPGGDVALAP